MIHIVVGCGFGDEGKGVFVNKLASESEYPMVIRHNGGHQAGHTVKLRNGISHVFSNLGAGTLAGAPTFISNFCTFEPTGFLAEHKQLVKYGYQPKVFVDPLAMITTPYDIFSNVKNNSNLKHGTVGVGFGATIERNLGPCKLYAQDLQFPEITRKKLEAIKEYTYRKFILEYPKREVESIPIEQFLFDCDRAFNLIEIFRERDIFEGNYSDYIFEGAQGVLLDMDFGVFPNVTRSNTTSKNAFQMIERNRYDGSGYNVYHLTRSYSTRHGAGWFPAEKHPVFIKNNEEETNVNGSYQKEFRTGIFDLDMFIYACQCESNFSSRMKNHLVISCMDQIEEFYLIRHGEVSRMPDGKSFVEEIKFVTEDNVGSDYFDGKVFLNYSPFSDTYIECNMPDAFDRALNSINDENDHERGLAFAQQEAERRDEPDEQPREVYDDPDDWPF